MPPRALAPTMGRMTDPIAPAPAHCPSCGQTATRATRKHISFDTETLRPVLTDHRAEPCGCRLDADQHADLLDEIFAPPPGWE